MEGLRDKVAIVTGGATMIGASVVRAFHRAGTRVAIADVNMKDGQAIADELRPGVIFVKTDLADDAQIAACVETTAKTFGGIDFLVNVACVYTDNALASTRQEWLESFNINVVGGRVDAASGATAHGEARRGRGGEFWQHQRKSGADGALALPGKQIRHSATHPQRSHGPGCRQNSREFGITRLDVVPLDGRANTRR